MKHAQGMCYNDIGVALCCSSKHAKNLVYKAKKTLRSRYEQQ
jgi:DNA-directed RNA polymerase specialized sigma24 family protein